MEPQLPKPSRTTRSSSRASSSTASSSVVKQPDMDRADIRALQESVRKLTESVAENEAELRKVREELKKDGLSDTQRERLEQEKVALISSIAAKEQASLEFQRQITAEKQIIASEKHARVLELQNEKKESQSSSSRSSVAASDCSGKFADTFGGAYLVVSTKEPASELARLGELVAALKRDSHRRPEVVAADTRADYVARVEKAEARVVAVTGPSNDPLMKHLLEEVLESRESLRKVCVQDLLHDLVRDLLSADLSAGGLVLIPAEKGGSTVYLATEACLVSKGGELVNTKVSSKPDLVIQAGEVYVASVEVKRKCAKSVYACRGQAAANSFALLGQGSRSLETVRTVLTDGTEWIFMEATREVDDEDVTYSLSRTDPLADAMQIAAGLAWWRDGVRGGAAAGEREKNGDGGGSPGGSGGKRSDKRSDEENKGGKGKKGKDKDKRGEGSLSGLRGQPDPSLMDKLALLNF